MRIAGAAGSRSGERGRLTVSLPRLPSCSAIARQAAERAFADEVSTGRLYDLKLVVTELVDNAYVHGRGKIDISLWRDGGRIRVEVIDQGDGATIGIRTRTDGIGGHGLRLVDKLSAAWGAFGETTHVWAELPVE